MAARYCAYLCETVLPTVRPCAKLISHHLRAKRISSDDMCFAMGGLRACLFYEGSAVKAKWEHGGLEGLESSWAEKS